MKCCEYPFLFMSICYLFSLENVSMRTAEKHFYGRFENIIRAKGQVIAGNYYFQFDVADSRYSITGLDSKSMGKMVFIGDGLRKKAIWENFCKSDKYKKIKYKA